MYKRAAGILTCAVVATGTGGGGNIILTRFHLHKKKKLKTFLCICFNYWFEKKFAFFFCCLGPRIKKKIWATHEYVAWRKKKKKIWRRPTNQNWRNTWPSKATMTTLLRKPWTTPNTSNRPMANLQWILELWSCCARKVEFANSLPPIKSISTRASNSRTQTQPLAFLMLLASLSNGLTARRSLLAVKKNKLINEKKNN